MSKQRPVADRFSARSPKAAADLQTLIRHTLDAVGRTRNTALTAFTDGCPGLRRILADAGVTTPPMLDWFHIAMRLQHLKQIAGGLSDDDPERAAAKTVIVAEVERGSVKNLGRPACLWRADRRG